MPTSNYEFFYRSQTILCGSDRSPQVSYAILEGQVATMLRNEVVKTLGPGQFLTTQALRQTAGAVAIAHTNCRLMAINPLMLSVMAHRPPEAILRVLQQRLAWLPKNETSPQLHWPPSLLARGETHRHRRLREMAQVIETVQQIRS